MIQAVLKLVAITAGTLILSFFGLFFIRWMGSQQVFKAPPHPWFEQAEWKIQMADSADFCTPNGLESAPADRILAVPLVRENDQWFLPCDPKIEASKFFQGQKHTNWMITLQAASTTGLDQLVQSLAPLNSTRYFAIMASSQKVSRYLRKKAPEWLYAADSASLLRFQLFTNLWIETAMDFWPDFVVIDNEDVRHWDSRATQELQRRWKRVIWKSANNEHSPKQISFQGVMTNRP